MRIDGDGWVSGRRVGNQHMTTARTEQNVGGSDAEGDDGDSATTEWECTKPCMDERVGGPQRKLESSYL